MSTIMQENIMKEQNLEYLRDKERIAASYSFVERYAREKHLQNLTLALPRVRDAFMRASQQNNRNYMKVHGYTASLHHGLSVCRMLIDLHIPVSEFGEDILLTAALCHVLRAVMNGEELDTVITHQFRLDPEVYDILEIISHEETMSDEETKAYYQRVQENKLALLIRLADRSSIVERLYDFSVWRSNRYIYETIEYFFPMCIYAKEHYPELTAAVSILMEKIKSLMEVGEILIGRFDVQEKQMMKEIMTLREENARIRGIIKKLKSEK